jgi:hypothetical protein
MFLKLDAAKDDNLTVKGPSRLFQNAVGPFFVGYNISAVSVLIIWS